VVAAKREANDAMVRRIIPAIAREREWGEREV
jgi:hypothetical protein